LTATWLRARVTTAVFCVTALTNMTAVCAVQHRVQCYNVAVQHRVGS